MTKQMTTMILMAAVTACGGGKTADNASTGTPVPASPDSLVALADAGQLPPPPPKVETVVVNKPTPATPPRTNPPRATPPRTTPPPASTAGTGSATTPTPPPAPKAAVAGTGQAIVTTLVDSVHSRYTKVGDAIRVRVAQDVSSSDGREVIPAGSMITLYVTAIAQADSRGEKGTLTLKAREVEIDGKSHAINAEATDYEYEMRARGVQSGDVAKTGAGAAAGAIIGRVAGGKKGTLGGALIGGAVGAAVASSTANRDIIVHAGQKMTLTLRDDFSRS